MRTVNRLTAGTAGLAACATAAGMLLLGAGAAHAATTPPWEPDANSKGTIAFYDASGTQIYSGTNTDGATGPFAAYAVGSAYPTAGDTKAEIVFAQPDPNVPNSQNWYAEAAGVYTTNPVTDTSVPANIRSASSSGPAVKSGSGDQTLEGFQSDAQQPTAAGYVNMIQVRIVTATSAGTVHPSVYDVADIMVDPTAHTWQQVYPAPPAANATTSTTLTASPNPAVQGSSVTLTATETASDSTHPAGNVQFMDGSTAVGSPVAVNASGVATASTSTLSVGTHSLTAVFTPTATGYNGSTSSAVSEVIQAPATATTTTLAVNQDGTAGDDATLTATVSPAAAAGTVSFYDNGSTTPLNSSPVTSSTGTFTYDLPTGFAAGAHSVVAKFTPTNSANYNSSQSAANTFTTQPKATGDCPTPSSCNDPQNVQVTIPNGTLSITTPYTASNPLDLGTATLTANNAQYTASGSFSKIEVVDTRAGAKGYTVSALSSNLTDGKSNPGSVINSQNVGLTNLAVTANSTSGSIAGTQNPAASPAVGPTATGNAGLGGTTPHTVFTNTNGLGTVDVSGTVTINAPTSTEAGLFLGTITFTVA